MFNKLANDVTRRMLEKIAENTYLSAAPKDVKHQDVLRYDGDDIGYEAKQLGKKLLNIVDENTQGIQRLGRSVAEGAGSTARGVGRDISNAVSALADRARGAAAGPLQNLSDGVDAMGAAGRSAYEGASNAASRLLNNAASVGISSDAAIPAGAGSGILGGHRAFSPEAYQAKLDAVMAGNPQSIMRANPEAQAAFIASQPKDTRVFSRDEIAGTPGFLSDLISTIKGKLSGLMGGGSGQQYASAGPSDPAALKALDYLSSVRGLPEFKGSGNSAETLAKLYSLHSPDAIDSKVVDVPAMGGWAENGFGSKADEIGGWIANGFHGSPAAGLQAADYVEPGMAELLHSAATPEMTAALAGLTGLGIIGKNRAHRSEMKGVSDALAASQSKNKSLAKALAAAKAAKPAAAPAASSWLSKLMK